MTKTIRAIPTAFLMATFAVVLPAQEPPPMHKAAAQPPPEISMEFGGGSLRELIDAMRRGAPKLNIITSALAREVKLPDLSVKGASVFDVLNAAARIAPHEYAVVCHQSDDLHEKVYTVVVERRLVQGMQGMPKPPDEREVRVFSLAALTEAQPVDRKDKAIAMPVSSVLSALEAGVAMVGGQAAELKYHGESKLLFVNGSSEQINVVREVLQNLQQDQQGMRQALFAERRHADEEAQRAKSPEGKMDKK